MLCTNPSVALLSNYEVFTFLSRSSTPTQPILSSSSTPSTSSVPSTTKKSKKLNKEPTLPLTTSTSPSSSTVSMEGSLAFQQMRTQVMTSISQLTPFPLTPSTLHLPPSSSSSSSTLLCASPLWTETQWLQCLKRFSNFQLLKSERLQIFNTRPTNLVGLYTCIEEADARFSTDQLLEMLGYLDTYLPLPSSTTTTTTTTMDSSLPFHYTVENDEVQEEDMPYAVDM